MNIRQVRKKIKTVSNVRKITKAMQLVAAIKMKKAQQEFIEGKPYRETLEKVIRIVVQRINPSLSKLLIVKPGTRELAILFSSNKGLCGSFNVNLLSFTFKNLDFAQTDFIVLGKKASFLVSKMGGKIIADFSETDPKTSFSAIFNLSLNKYLTNEYQKVHVIYNKFFSTLKIFPVKETILPVHFAFEEAVIKIKEDYVIEPKPELIIDHVLKSYVEEKVRDAFLSSEAGEHSARMMAMKNATENASDLIYELTMLRNKLRQEKITYELLDMITAKESVEEKQ